MESQLHNLTRGVLGFEIEYTLILLTIIGGLWHARSGLKEYLLSPVLALAMTLFVGIVLSLVSVPLSIFGEGAQVFLGVCISIAMSYAAGRVLATYNDDAGPKHRRGSRVTTSLAVASTRNKGFRQTEKVSGNGAGITLAGVPVDLQDETKHFKIIGTTGTGKSTAIRELLTGAFARGDRAIIADPDGAYTARFYDPNRGDIILNPFHSEGRKWDPFGEVVNPYDIDQLARSLVPDGSDSDRIWTDYGRTFFATVMRQTMRTQQREVGELFRLLTAAPDHELRTLLAGTACAPFLEEGSEKMFGCVRSGVGAAVKVLEYIIEQRAASFSVRQWVRESSVQQPGTRGGVLFIPYTAGEIAALRSVISAWMRLGIFQAMDGPEGDQRLWFVIDELDALGEIDGLKDALARLRKFGGRCILGLQSISQVSTTYGKGTADTIVENCGTTLILRCSASEHGGTSEFASKLIGQCEVLHSTQSKTRNGNWRSSITTSQQIRIEPAVMASEIERLPDLTGFLKFASIPDWQMATLTRISDPTPIRTSASVVPSNSPTPAASPRSKESSPAPAAPPLTLSPAAAYAPKRPTRKRKPRSIATPVTPIKQPQESPTGQDRAP